MEKLTFPGGWGRQSPISVDAEDAEKSAERDRRLSTISPRWEKSTSAVPQGGGGAGDSPRFFPATAITAGCRGLRDASVHSGLVPSLAVSISREWSAFLRMCQVGWGESFSRTNTVTYLPIK